MTIKHVYNWGDYREERESRGETNDCTVVSLAQVLEIPYGEAHGIMRAHGRVKGRGCHMSAPAASYPAVFTKVQGLEPDEISLAEFCRTHKVGRYWVEVTGHALAVVNGKVVDHSRKVRRRVQRAWKVTKANYHGDPPKLLQ